MFGAFFGYGGDPQGPLRVPNGSYGRPCAMSQDKILYMAIYDYIWDFAMEKLVVASDEFRHFLGAFRLSGAPKAPWGSSKASEG